MAGIFPENLVSDKCRSGLDKRIIALGKADQVSLWAKLRFSCGHAREASYLGRIGDVLHREPLIVEIVQGELAIYIGVRRGFVYLLTYSYGAVGKKRKHSLRQAILIALSLELE